MVMKVKAWRYISGKHGDAEMATLGRELFAMAQRVAVAKVTQKDSHVQAYRAAMAKAQRMAQQRERALAMAREARHYLSRKYQEQAGHTASGKVIRPIPVAQGSR